MQNAEDELGLTAMLRIWHFVQPVCSFTVLVVNMVTENFVLILGQSFCSRRVPTNEGLNLVPNFLIFTGYILTAVTFFLTELLQ